MLNLLIVKYLLKDCNKSKRKPTNECMIKYQAYCTRIVVIGSVICHKWRLITYRNKQLTPFTSIDRVEVEAVGNSVIIGQVIPLIGH